MTSLNWYHAPVILIAVIGVGLFISGAWGVYVALPEHSYSVNGPQDPNTDIDDHHGQPIQFEDLSDTGQEAFLEAVNQDGSSESYMEPSVLEISGDYQQENYVEYQGQIYQVVVWAPSGMAMIPVIAGVFVSLIGLMTIWEAIQLKKWNSFKLSTALLSGALVLGLALYFYTHSLSKAVPAILLAPVVTYYILVGIEQRYDMSFPQKMNSSENP